MATLTRNPPQFHSAVLSEEALASHDEILEAWSARMDARHRLIGHEFVFKRDDVRAFWAEYRPDGLLEPDPDTIRAQVARWILEAEQAADAEKPARWEAARRRELSRPSSFHEIGLVKPFAPEQIDAKIEEERAAGAVERWDEGPLEGPEQVELVVAVGSADFPTFEEFRRFDMLDAVERDAFNARLSSGLMREWVPDRGAVGALVRLSETIRDGYGWTKESAARWLIVRDAQPHIPHIRTRVFRGEESDEEGRSLHAWARIEFPLDIPSSRIRREIEELQELYAAAHAFRLSSPRPELKRNLELVVFCQLRNDGHRTWMDVLREWNAEHPEDTFEENRKGVHLLAKTARATYRSIMGPHRTLEWKTTSESD